MKEENRRSINIPKKLLEGATVYSDLYQEIVLTNTDKLRLTIQEYQNTLKGKKQWVTPFSILCTLAATFFTTSFKTFLGLSADIWQALFIFSAILSGVFFINGTIRSFLAWKKGNIETLIEDLKERSKQ